MKRHWRPSAVLAQHGRDEVLYADSGLRSLEGHHASSGVALGKAFRDLGHDVTTLGHRDLVPALQRRADARPFFRAFTYGGPSSDPIAGWLTNFTTAVEATVEDLGRAWAEFGPFDLIYFNSAKPAQIAALGLWMKAEFASPQDAPSIAVELGTEAGLARSTAADGPAFSVREPTAILYRHLGAWVGKEWLGRIVFVAMTAAAAEEYTFILDLPVHVAPMPQALPTLRRRHTGEGLVIGLVGHQRPDKGYQLAPGFIPLVLQRHAGVRFLAHQSDPEGMVEVTAALRMLAAGEPRLELLVGPAIADSWFALLDRCDIVALPYDPARYEGAYSAIVGESLAAGAPVVVPAATTMSAAIEAMADGAAVTPGIAFAHWEAASIADAIGIAIDRFPELAESAHAAGAAWREKHGPDRFVASVIDAAGAGNFSGSLRRAARRAKWRLGGWLARRP